MDTKETLVKENHGLPKICRIDNRKEYLKAIDNARRICYYGKENRSAWQEQYYSELTILIVEYARLH